MFHPGLRALNLAENATHNLHNVLTLRGALGRLPTEQRQVIELKYLVGMTNEEVAVAMGTTPGAVNARRWRALKALADVLEERA